MFPRPHGSCVTDQDASRNAHLGVVRGWFCGPDDGSHTIATIYKETNDGDEENDREEDHQEDRT